MTGTVVAVVLTLATYVIIRLILDHVIQAPPLVANVLSFLIAGFILIVIMMAVGSGATP